jgi:hypothetical protein
MSCGPFLSTDSSFCGIKLWVHSVQNYKEFVPCSACSSETMLRNLDAGHVMIRGPIRGGNSTAMLSTSSASWISRSKSTLTLVNVLGFFVWTPSTNLIPIPQTNYQRSMSFPLLEVQNFKSDFPMFLEYPLKSVFNPDESDDHRSHVSAVKYQIHSTYTT